ncbi:MAG: cohesin domain-containing protein [bacterium]
MIRSRRIYLVVLALLVGVLSLTCSENRTTESEMVATDVQMSIANSTLAGAISTVSLKVYAAEDSVFGAQATVLAGEFSFGTISLPVGELIFVAQGRSATGQLLYEGSTEATIISGGTTTVDLELLPAIPMSKLSPYVAEVSVGEQFTSTLEIFELQRFYNGSFRFNYNTSLLRFESVLSSYSSQWGGLIHFSHEEDGELVVSVSRTGENDLVPGNLYSLVDLRFTALSPGTAKLSLDLDSLEDLDGRVAEFNSIFIDTQTVVISGQ